MSNMTQLPEQENREFILPGMADPGAEFTEDEMADDMAGLNLSFQRIKIPSGGILRFEIPSDNPERPNYTEYIEGVILHSHPSNAYWPGGEYDEDMAAPLCSSSDSVTGHGEPGGACAVCPLNQWGTSENGKGKACKNMRQMYILRSGECMPIQLTLSPTSIRPYNDFFSVAFAARRRATFGSVVRIGLKKMNNGKDDYSVATFQRLSDFSGEELAAIRSYAANFKEHIKYMLSQRAAETEPAGNDADLPGLDSLEPLNYPAPAVIDGERQPLPA